MLAPIRVKPQSSHTLRRCHLGLIAAGGLCTLGIGWFASFYFAALAAVLTWYFKQHQQKRLAQIDSVRLSALGWELLWQDGRRQKAECLPSTRIYPNLIDLHLKLLPTPGIANSTTLKLAIFADADIEGSFANLKLLTRFGHADATWDMPHKIH